MLGLLKKLFGGKPTVEIIVDIEADLKPAKPNGLDGEVEYTAWNDGRYCLSFEMDQSTPEPTGAIDVYLNGVPVLSMELTPPETRMRRTEADGPMSEAPRPGDHVDIRQNGIILVEGVFRHD